MTTSYLECHEGKSNKFYEITLAGNNVVTRYGACGAPGVTGTKSFANGTEAQKFFDKTLAEKKKKGYNVMNQAAEGQEEMEEEEEEQTTKAAAKSKTAAKKRGAATETEDAPTAKKASKKRGAPEANEEEQKKKVVKKTPFIDSVIQKLVVELQAKSDSQKEGAKEKEWTYDPRPAIDPNHVTLAQVLQEIKGYNAATIDAIAKLIEKVAEEGEIEGFLTQIVEEFGSTADVFEENQLFTLTVHRFLEGTLARDFLTVLKEENDESWENATNAKELLSAFKTHFPIAKSLEKFPVLHAYKVDSSEFIPEVEDSDESGLDWWEQFCHHMLFLYNHLDKYNCRCIGRIVAAFNQNEDLYEKFLPSIQEGDEDEDNEEIKEFLNYIKKKYSVGKALAKLTKPQIYTLAVREILKEPLDCRTFFGSFCYCTRETDYCGTLSGIAGFSYEQTMSGVCYDEGVVKVLQLIRQSLILGQNDLDAIDELAITSAFYVPGMKVPGFGDDEEEEEMVEEEEN